MIKSARADCEKIWVLMMALFCGNTLCIVRKSDEIRAQIFRKMPQAIYSAFTKEELLSGTTATVCHGNTRKKLRSGSPACDARWNMFSTSSKISSVGGNFATKDSTKTIVMPIYCLLVQTFICLQWDKSAQIGPISHF